MGMSFASRSTEPGNPSDRHTSKFQYYPPDRLTAWFSPVPCALIVAKKALISDTAPFYSPVLHPPETLGPDDISPLPRMIFPWSSPIPSVLCILFFFSPFRSWCGFLRPCCLISFPLHLSFSSRHLYYCPLIHSPFPHSPYVTRVSLKPVLRNAPLHTLCSLWPH